MVNTFQDIIGKFLNSLRLVALWLEIRSEFEVHFRITTENKDLMKPQRHREKQEARFFLAFCIFASFFNLFFFLCVSVPLWLLYFSFPIFIEQNEAHMVQTSFSDGGFSLLFFLALSGSMAVFI